ncbi:uncharacterized protein LOC143299416 [Babylonia areolata]|uniref:uncharacterized protein LOC143299416 n=1 Tax=Babylonia areolata TaxID=304850 RepID=UPI003FD2C891
MADCSDGGSQVDSAVLPDHLNLDSLMASDQMKEDDEEGEIPGEETGASLLGDILEMEGTEADLKEEDASLMEALAECEGKDDDDADYGSGDEEGDDEEEDSDDEDDGDDDAEDSDEDSEEGGEEFDQNKGAEESIDFGEMPDFSSMMEADGSSLEGAVAGDIGLKALQESELMDADSNPVKQEPESSSEKGGSAKKTSRKRKKKMLKEKGKRLTKRLKREKRKKKKAKKDDESKVDPSTLKASERRRNIRKILGEKDLDQETLDAQKEELERQQRLKEQMKHAMSSQAAAAKPPPVSSISTGTATTSTSSAASKEQDSQLKSLLQSAEEEADKQEKKQAEKQEKKQAEISVMTEIKKEVQVKQEKVDVIELSSDSEDESNEDDCVMVPSTEEEDEEEVEAEDLNDGGAHINDEYNQRDDQGRVLVNVGHTSEDPDVFLSPQMAKAIKPHQIGGVRFLYDNLVESLPRFNTSQGFGCILAHSMGLGKTIQVIAFIDIFLRHTSAKRVLCIVPINTLQNWMAEFNMWAPSKEKPPPDTQEVRHRKYKVFLLSENLKTTAQRARIIGDWKETGGVLLMGYEMYRLLSSRRSYTPKNKKKKKKPEEKKDGDVIDVDEEDKNKSLMTDMYGALVNPGPDLVVCDEGHRIKNNHASISQSLKQIRTKRRVVLTGYPLQNSLMEYWCMVDFVRPNFLGNKTEFSNMFERPIMNGQCQDSTAEDIKIMKHRAYVLHNLLEGFVQRRGHTVLQHALPFKHEYVFLVRMSPIQRKLYRRYIDSLEESTSLAQANSNPLKAFSVGCKIWNHPDILHKSVVLKKPVIEENDLDIESSEVNGGKKKLKKSDSTSSLASTASMSSVASSMSNITVGSNVSQIPGLPDSVSSSNFASDVAAANGAPPSLSSADGADASVPDSDASATGFPTGPVNGEVPNGTGTNSGVSPAGNGKTGGSVTFSLETGTNYSTGADSSTGTSSGTAMDTGTGLGVSSDTSNSNSISTGTGQDTAMSTTTTSTDTPETCTGVSSSTDTNMGVSTGTDTTTSGVSTGTDTTTSGVSTGTATTATGVSTGTETSTGVSTGTGTTETSVGTGTGENECSTPLPDKKEDEHAWVGDAFDDYEAGVLEHGPKMVLLNTVVEESLKIGDKILVFSQSLSTLDTIEEFMSKLKVPRPDMDENWSKNRSYFRLDGSTSSTERERLITEFNRSTNTTAWMFLLSTRAGCLGINMIGANRVVVLDASWNPCHDCQAVCRVFRFGQTKQSYVYRLVTENTLERNIYDRQITKQGMSDRVIDEMNPDNHFSKGQMENLLKNEDKDFPYLDFTNCDDNYEDPVMVSVLKKQGQWITKEPFTHESLLIDRKELRMSKKEKLQAKEGYARDKRMNITYSRPSYAAYYPGGGSQMYIRRGPVSRPIASVRPMISSSISRPTVQVVKPGVTVHQVITTTDILLPGTNTATSAGGAEPAGKIASGQKILVIKTPKGVYIRTNDGKMFAVRSKVAGTDDATSGITTTASTVVGANTTTTTTATTVSSGTRVALSAPPPPRIFFKTPDGKLTEKNPSDVKGGASLLANIYQQTGGANTVFKRNNKGQIMRVLPAAPIRTLNRPRPAIVASAAATSKASKPPVEVIVYPRSKVISTGRACKVLDKPGETSGKSASTVVVQPQDSMMTSVSASTTTLKRIEPAPAKADSSTSPPDTSPKQARDSQVMKLLATDDEENVGKSDPLASAPEKKDAGSGEKMTVDGNRETNESADSGRPSSDKTSNGSGGKLTDSAQSSPSAADSGKTSFQEQKKDFAAPAPLPPVTSHSLDIPRQESSSQGSSNANAASQPLETPLPQSQGMVQAPAQLAPVSQQSSQPVPPPGQQAFNSNQPAYSANNQQPFNSQPHQQPFGNQPAAQPGSTGPPFAALSSSQQQSYSGQPPQQPFSQQPQPFSNQPTNPAFSHHTPQQAFNGQQSHFSNQPSTQPPHFSNQSSAQPAQFNQPSSQPPHFSSQSSSQPPQFNNPPSNQSQNFNTPPSSQPSQFSSMTSSQTSHFNQSSSQPPQFSNQSVSQPPQFNNQSSSQPPQFNNQSSSQTPQFNSQSSSQTPQFNSQSSSQTPQFSSQSALRHHSSATSQILNHHSLMPSQVLNHHNSTPSQVLSRHNSITSPALSRHSLTTLQAIRHRISTLHPAASHTASALHPAVSHKGSTPQPVSRRVLTAQLPAIHITTTVRLPSAVTQLSSPSTVCLGDHHMEATSHLSATSRSQPLCSHSMPRFLMHSNSNSSSNSRCRGNIRHCWHSKRSHSSSRSRSRSLTLRRPSPSTTASVPTTCRLGGTCDRHPRRLSFTSRGASSTRPTCRLHHHSLTTTLTTPSSSSSSSSCSRSLHSHKPRHNRLHHNLSSHSHHKLRRRGR